MNMKNIPLLISSSPRAPRAPRAFLTLFTAGAALSFAAPAEAQRSQASSAAPPSAQQSAQAAGPFGQASQAPAQQQAQRQQQARQQQQQQPGAQSSSQWHSGDEWFNQETRPSAGSENWMTTRPGSGAPFHIWDPQAQTWVIIDREAVAEQFQALQRGEAPPKIDPQRIQRLSPAQHEQLDQQMEPQHFSIQQGFLVLPEGQQGQQGQPGQPGQPGQQGQPDPQAQDTQQAKKELKQQAKQARDAAKQQQAQQPPKRQQPQDLQPVTIQGRIEGFREVGIKDDSGLWQDHTLVRIRLDSGTESVVDIGRRMDLVDIDLQQGQQIQINGHQGQLDNQQIVVADQIQSGQRTFNIARNDQRQEISGRITDVSKIDLNKQGEDSLLVRLKMDDGSAVVVDLGKDTNLEDLDLEKNSQVRVRGEREFIDGKSILVAEQISVDGESTQLPQQQQDPQQDPQQGPQQQQLQQQLQRQLQQQLQQQRPEQQQRQQQPQAPQSQSQRGD
jgi:hypothetical protein